MLNSSSPIPLYHQLADLLAARVRSGEYSAGSKIPSEPELARKFGIGRPTVRGATDLLVRRGLLVRRRGSGTFVRERPDEVDIFTLAGTLASFKDSGLDLKTNIVQRLRRRVVAEDPENPFSGREAYSFWRVSKLKGQPVLLETLFIDPEVFPELDKVNLVGRSLANVVEEHYYKKPEGGRQTFRIAYARGKKAEALEVSSRTPILLVRRTLSFPGAEDAIHSELYCRTDKVVFSQVLGGTSDA